MSIMAGASGEVIRFEDALPRGRLKIFGSNNLILPLSLLGFSFPHRQSFSIVVFLHSSCFRGFFSLRNALLCRIAVLKNHEVLSYANSLSENNL